MKIINFRRKTTPPPPPSLCLLSLREKAARNRFMHRQCFLQAAKAKQRAKHPLLKLLNIFIFSDARTLMERAKDYQQAYRECISAIKMLKK